MSLCARFREIAQIWTIYHSLLLDHVSGTPYLSNNVILNSPSGSCTSCCAYHFTALAQSNIYLWWNSKHHSYSGKSNESL